jgi:hypothetical protein
MQAPIKGRPDKQINCRADPLALTPGGCWINGDCEVIMPAMAKIREPVEAWIQASRCPVGLKHRPATAAAWLHPGNRLAD